MSTERTFPPVRSQSAAWIKAPEALYSQEHHSLQSECINLCNWKETCSLQVLLKWQNYTLKQKKRLTKPSVNLVKSQVADSCEKTVSNLKKRQRMGISTGCGLFPSNKNVRNSQFVFRLVPVNWGTGVSLSVRWQMWGFEKCGNVLYFTVGGEDLLSASLYGLHFGTFSNQWKEQRK